jgi:hypothetical protein
MEERKLMQINNRRWKSYEFQREVVEKTDKLVSEAFRTSGNVTARGGSQVPNEYFCLHYKN